MSKPATMGTEEVGPEVRQHCTAEVADPDEGDVLAHGAVEEVADAGEAGVHVVAPVGAARVADHHEVAADLGGGHPGVPGELVRVDVVDAACARSEDSRRR